MKIQLNGASKKTDSRTVVELLEELKLLPSQVAVEHNGAVLFRHELEQAVLAEGDRIELVRVVAGG